MAREWTSATRRERKFTVEVTRSGDCKRLLRIEIPREELEHEEAAVLAELRKDLKVPGFRKGKVPVKYIEKNYAGAIHADAVRNLLPHVYEDALVRENITPVGEPKFENVKTDEGDTITFDVAVEVRPEVEVKGYRGVRVTVEKRTIEETNVDEALEHMRERLTTLRVVDREVRENDYVLIDYGPLLASGEVDEKRLSRNYPVDLAGGSLLNEFREGLVGMSTGEEKDILVQYPDDFPEKATAGTRRTFRCTVKEIKQKELPELDDGFAKRVGEQFENLEDLRKQVREDLIKEEDKRFEHEAEERIIDSLIRSNPFDVPEAMVQNYIRSVLEEDRKRRPNVADESEREREVAEHFREAAVRTIKKYFILESVKKQEEIALGAGEVEAKIEEITKDRGLQPEEVREYFKHPQRRQSLENDLLDQKVLNLLRDNADIKVAG